MIAADWDCARMTDDAAAVNDDFRCAAANVEQTAAHIASVLRKARF